MSFKVCLNQKVKDKLLTDAEVKRVLDYYDELVKKYKV